MDFEIQSEFDSENQAVNGNIPNKKTSVCNQILVFFHSCLTAKKHLFFYNFSRLRSCFICYFNKINP